VGQRVEIISFHSWLAIDDCSLSMARALIYICFSKETNEDSSWISSCQQVLENMCPNAPKALSSPMMALRKATDRVTELSANDRHKVATPECRGFCTHSGSKTERRRRHDGVSNSLIRSIRLTRALVVRQSDSILRMLIRSARTTPHSVFEPCHAQALYAWLPYLSSRPVLFSSRGGIAIEP
jgi:hypothetical protein